MLETTGGIVTVSLFIFLVFLGFIVFWMCKKAVDDDCDRLLGKRK